MSPKTEGHNDRRIKIKCSMERVLRFFCYRLETGMTDGVCLLLLKKFHRRAKYWLLIPGFDVSRNSFSNDGISGSLYIPSNMLQGDENQSHGIYNTNIFCEISIIIKLQRTDYALLTFCCRSIVTVICSVTN